MSKQTLHLTEDFFLESGKYLSGGKITYHTWGKLNAQRNNVLMIVHALTANSDISEWWSGLFGPGNLYDPDKYFIICANNLGSPYGTTSPLSTNPLTGKKYGMEFPFFTIRDTANLHLHLLEKLQIKKIHCLIGPSCGGNIAQEMALAMGKNLNKLGLLCCSAQESPWVIAIHEAQRMALQIDPGFKSGEGYTGLRAARAMAMPFYRSHQSFSTRQSESDNSKISDFRASSYINYQGLKFEKRFDAFAYYHLINALDTHNLGRGRDDIKEVLKRIQCKTLCMSFSSDILVPPVEQALMANQIPSSQYVNIESPNGHDAFLIETDLVRERLSDFIHSP